MSAGSRTLTPISLAPQTVAAQDPTGTWTHPKLDEINRRLGASTFGDRQIKSIAWNTTLMLLTFALPRLSRLHWLYVSTPVLLHVIQCSLTPSSSFARPILELNPDFNWWLKWSLRGYAAFIICLALLPLLYNKDDLSDIPLTPTQRSLLGLGPSSQPATPGSQYITPPRYSRSSTPRSGASSRSASPYSASPIGGLGGGAGTYSPTASPLYQKALGRDVTRRLSYGSPSQLGMSRMLEQSSSSLTSNNTPSPMPGRGASVSINNKWLYEKGRGSPSSLRGSFS